MNRAQFAEFKPTNMTTTTQERIFNYLPENAKQVVQAFETLTTDDKLALLYLIYEKMGGSITPAAPLAADPNLAPTLLPNFLQLSEQEQLGIMRAIVNRQDTEYSRYYGALSENNRLLVWYVWAAKMGDTVVDLPQDYKTDPKAQDILRHLENLEFQEQISVLRTVAANMGYSEVEPVPSQEETGKTPSL